MQIPILWKRGQTKPYGSIPRVNWAHPLARNLVIYCYDAGGTYVDLVNAGLSTLQFTSGRRTSKLGAGVLYPTGGWAFMPQSIAASNVGAAAPFSAAIGTFYPSALGVSSGTVAVTGTVSNSADTPVGFSTGSSNGMQAVFDNGTFSVDFTFHNITTSTFQTWGYSATSGTTADLYADGVFNRTASAIVTTLSIGPGRVLFNSAQANVSAFGGGLNGFLPYFAIWDKRVLSPADWRLLHDDPYCFLIYPEDDIFAELVGSGVAPPPGPGPNFLTSLMPMMGVG